MRNFTNGLFFFPSFQRSWTDWINKKMLIPTHQSRKNKHLHPMCQKPSSQKKPSSNSSPFFKYINKYYTFCKNRKGKYHPAHFQSHQTNQNIYQKKKTNQYIFIYIYKLHYQFFGKYSLIEGDKKAKSIYTWKEVINMWKEGTFSLPIKMVQSKCCWAASIWTKFAS